jgi:glycosyltransferase involved in cell wall biosynthesis
MEFSLNLPINSVSFGQVSSLLLKELFLKNKVIPISPIGQVDLSSQNVDKDYTDWLQTNLNLFLSKHSRKNKIFKLWHINGSLESFSENQVLFSFYELDSPTDVELNIVKNNYKVIFSSKYAIETFKKYGCSNLDYLPLAFDKYNFKRVEKDYFSDRIVFNLLGKLEKRKHHKKVIQAWLKKFGNDRRYHLQCAIYNPFIKPEDQQNLIQNSILENKNFFNISFLNFIPKNSDYNDLLNSGDIVLGMSGAEGWGLPEFHSVAIGKHSVILNAHSYKEWADESNSILVNPSSKIEAYDNMFFHKGQIFNQGNIYDFNEDEFIVACEKAIEKVQSSKLNKNGLKLQETFSSEKFADNVLSIMSK